MPSQSGALDPVPHRYQIGFSYPLCWQLYPCTYMACNIAPALAARRYPYPFLNVAKGGYKGALWNGLPLLALLLAMAILLVILDRWLSGRLSD
ncbi:MAG: Pr6Pr family membrane protein [Rhodomicrobium sp.]|nr:Pr6Pr family membrane protein [Rhodomicrobium sp.]